MSRDSFYETFAVCFSSNLFLPRRVADKDWGADFRKLSAGAALVGLTLWLDHMQAKLWSMIFYCSVNRAYAEYRTL